jgi:DedD protein
MNNRMGWWSVFQREHDGKAGRAPRNKGSASELAESVQRARTRAKHRLIGTALLVLVGVIGFPLLFETEPRAISQDLAIEWPSKEASASGKGLDTNKTSSSSSKQAKASHETDVFSAIGSTPKKSIAGTIPAIQVPGVSPALSGRQPGLVITEKHKEKETNIVGPSSIHIQKTGDKSKPVSSTEKMRLGDLSDGAFSIGEKVSPLSTSPVTKNETGLRFIVQIGAFAESTKAQQVRMKVESLGLKTYVNRLKTPTGERIRVRVGPLATRAEADKVVQRLKSAGVPSAVLTL